MTQRTTASVSIRYKTGDFEWTDFYLSTAEDRPLAEVQTLVHRAMLATMLRVHKNRGDKDVKPITLAKKYGLVYAFEKLPEDDLVDPAGEDEDLV
jgi:hypothetical protein